MFRFVPFFIGLMACVSASAQAASVSGTATFDGERPEPTFVELIEKGGKVSDCSALHLEGLRAEKLIVGEDKEIANVFVYVRKGLPRKKYPKPSEPAVLNQLGCMFQPRVQGVMMGQDLLMRNSDPVLHNVRALSFRNRPFNIGQPAKSPDRTKSFRRKEKAVMIQCDLHPWMQAHVFVMDHPYFAVTDQSGQFEIPDLPVGDYTLTAWHEQLGEQDVEISVTEDGIPDIAFMLKPKKRERVMQGKLAANSPGARPAIPEPVAEQRPFVKKWELADLAADAADLSKRSKAKGSELFTAGGCIKCHVIAGKGTKLGPDLSDVTKRFKGAKLLEQMLKPSAEINKDFQTQLFLTIAGKTVSGLVIEENDEQVRLLPNPLKPEEVVVLKKDEIDERRNSDVSTMPESLLDTMNRDEILDLLAFVSAGGKI